MLNSTSIFQGSSKKVFQFICFLLLVAMVVTTSLVSFQPVSNARAAVSGFVTRSGNKLMLNGQQFRFSGANIYWLGLDENVGGIDYPTAFRVEDALATVKEMGGTVVRSHTIGFSTGCSKCIEPSRGTFNEAALVKADYAIKVAGDYGIRLILPLTDNWSWYHGGYHNFTDWRGLSTSAFWTDSTVIADFEQFISNRLNRVNTYTGVAYKNDPTIMAWETGNELGNPPTSWTTTIANYIKSIDGNHLVLDGNYGINSNALSISSVDMYSDHYYPISTSKLSSDASAVASKSKVFYVGEYDWNSNLSSLLSSVESNSTISGDTYWSLFPHRDDYGYVQHGDCCTLHYPGDSSTMRSVMQSLRIHSYKMQSVSAPAHGIPTAPLITNSNNPIAWRGAVSGDTYSIERSTDQVNWTVVCNRCVTDNNAPWNDSLRPSGTVYYRIRAFNLSGVAGPYSDGSSGATATSPAPTATSTNTPTGLTATPGGATTTVDDSVTGTGANQFNYSGGWSHCTNCNEGGSAIFYNASQSWDGTTNDSVTINFTGTQINYYAVKATDVGIAAVSIDGGTESTVDLYSSSKTGNVLVWSSPMLTSGSHTLKIRNTGSKNGSSSGSTITLDHVDITNSGSATSTPMPTNTSVPPTATRTNTPVSPTATRTNTPVGLTPTLTATSAPSATPVPTSGGGSTCTPTSIISAPFSFDGAGTFCWQSSSLGAYVNSWNVTSLKINGVDFTNIYVASANYPAQIGGFWYVSYSSTMAWGHFEAK